MIPFATSGGSGLEIPAEIWQPLHRELKWQKADALQQV
ncbi:MAG: hypothetical protein ACLRMZ_13375 [Blautia marasmi]